MLSSFEAVLSSAAIGIRRVTPQRKSGTRSVWRTELSMNDLGNSAFSVRLCWKLERLHLWVTIILSFRSSMLSNTIFILTLTGWISGKHSDGSLCAWRQQRKACRILFRFLWVSLKNALRLSFSNRTPHEAREAIRVLNRTKLDERYVQKNQFPYGNRREIRVDPDPGNNIDERKFGRGSTTGMQVFYFCLLLPLERCVMSFGRPMIKDVWE